MNIEEAIKTLKAYKKAFVFQTNISENDYSISVDTVLNLIEKLQKELDNRIPQEKVNELVDDYENQLTEKNNYIFNLESEREALWNKLDEEFE